MFPWSPLTPGEMATLRAERYDAMRCDDHRERRPGISKWRPDDRPSMRPRVDDYKAATMIECDATPVDAPPHDTLAFVMIPRTPKAHPDGWAFGSDLLDDLAIVRWH